MSHLRANLIAAPAAVGLIGIVMHRFFIPLLTVAALVLAVGSPGAPAADLDLPAPVPVLPSPLSKSYYGCRDAWQAYKDASNRNDTRGMELAERAARRHGDAHIANLVMWPSLRNKAMLAIDNVNWPQAFDGCVAGTYMSARR